MPHQRSSSTSSLLRTPPRSSKKRPIATMMRHTQPTTMSPFRTPTKSSSSQRRTSTTPSFRPRGTPAPSILFRSEGSFRTTPSSSTPSSSNVTPQKRRSSMDCGDRFIPSRRHMNISLCRRELILAHNNEESSSNNNSQTNRTNSPRSPTRNGNGNNGNGNNNDGSTNVATTTTPQQTETPMQKEYKRRMLSTLCNVPLEGLDENAKPRGLLAFGGSTNSSDMTASALKSSILREDPFAHDTLRVLQQFEQRTQLNSSGSFRPHDAMIHRKIPSQPSRILDAPDLVDDYYLNLISWGSDNILAVALSHCVYLWNAGTGQIVHLATISGSGGDDYVTSVSWCTLPGHSHCLAVGTNSNTVQLWDTQAVRRIRTLYGHSGRIASLAWNQKHSWLSSGGRDSLIIQHDVRAASHIVATYKGHEQEVCGLTWNDEGTTLASGGNENYLCIWDAAMSGASTSSSSMNRVPGTDVAPRLLMNQHKAAVKALDWCPFHRGLLASGGGTADRTIKLWNSNSGALMNSIDTGSQVCSLVWSKHQRELCSSHGFSENQLILWKYSNIASTTSSGRSTRSSSTNQSGGTAAATCTLTKMKELTGHTSRVLSLATSPDGSTVVSAAGDESLRFWNIFGAPPRSRSGAGDCSLSSSMTIMGELSSLGMPTIR